MTGRSKIDARKLPPKAQELLRRSAMERVDAGESPEDVAAGTGINRRTIYKWISAYHYYGEESFTTGKRPGRPAKLNGKQLEKLAKIIRTKNPQQLKFEYALWTIPMIRRLIREQFDVKLSEVSVGRLLKRLGLTPQRPLYRCLAAGQGIGRKLAGQGVSQVVSTCKERESIDLLC
ncbi:transposase [Wenzhouxiangella sp. AB-CW3]|uniref:winged helix-turn-helix domain-containing protein n=1 Tax=Wenzhouxiangella sp. AB-CW3 TaxID=2771012 RepID=UPI00168BD189|nr:winged helix-turn-helix domain-containing protein [Wenzhouxiangella sp. AB-CW3]QOC23781.1 transposase [Wenzhouxiangella sp. AB-CW3]